MTTADDNNLTSNDAPTSLSEWPSFTCMRCGFSVTEPRVDMLNPRMAEHVRECPELQADSSAAGFSARHAALFAAVQLCAPHMASQGRIGVRAVLDVAAAFERWLAKRPDDELAPATGDPDQPPPRWADGVWLDDEAQR